MIQTVFNGALHGRGEAGRFCRRLRRWILKWSDPMVRWNLNGRTLRLRLSHQLPFYRREFPTYSANLERLAAGIRRAYGRLSMIDVGANIGDSLALAGIRPGEPCLLIEGDAAYLRLLQENTADLPDVNSLGVLLSDRPGTVDAELVSEGGTGRILHRPGKNGSAPVETLDRIVAQRPAFHDARLVKIDVDGYDFRVLRGGVDFIKRAQPVLFFEQDPALLEAAGEDPDEVWTWLKAAGYTDVFLYDNVGYWVGAFALDDHGLLSQLNAYARQRPGSYYDVAAFAARHFQLRQALATSEKAFYGALTAASRTR
jgi:FkbM family methyltransferase